MGYPVGLREQRRCACHVGGASARYFVCWCPIVGRASTLWTTLHVRRYPSPPPGGDFLCEPVLHSAKAAWPYLVDGLAKHHLRPPPFLSHTPTLSRRQFCHKSRLPSNCLLPTAHRSESTKQSIWFVPSRSVRTVVSGTSSAGFAVLPIPPPPCPWPWPARACAVSLLPPPPAQRPPINPPTHTPVPIHSQCSPHVAVYFVWSCTGEPPQW